MYCFQALAFSDRAPPAAAAGAAAVAEVPAAGLLLATVGVVAAAAGVLVAPAAAVVPAALSAAAFAFSCKMNHVKVVQAAEGKHMLHHACLINVAITVTTAAVVNCCTCLTPAHTV